MFHHWVLEIYPVTQDLSFQAYCHSNCNDNDRGTSQMTTLQAKLGYLSAVIRSRITNNEIIKISGGKFLAVLVGEIFVRANFFGGNIC